MIGFIGHLHPLLVHLPIGILVLAFIFYWMLSLKQYEFLSRVMTLTLLAGTIGAFLSCITGYVLSLSGDYESEVVGWHQNVALLTTMLSLGWFYVMATPQKKGMRHLAAIVCMAGVFVTGHLGGTLTHGEGYLTGGAGSGDGPVVARKPVPDVNEAKLYADLVQPLLQEKCYSCHGANKQKGKLRLDIQEAMLKGGKGGVIIHGGDAAGSDFIKRLQLPRNDDDHMPPKEKPQLTEKEIALLHWWVASGASFDKSVKELAPPDSVRKVLLSFQGNSPAVSTSTPDIPSAAVSPAAELALKALKDRGAVVLPVAKESHYLQVNFVTVESFTDKDLQLLTAVKDQLAWLRLSGQPVSDAGINTLADCKNLTKLSLDHTKVTDASLKTIAGFNELKVLNVVGDDISLTGLAALKALPKLQVLFLYKTKLSGTDWNTLKQYFPKATIDTGGYKVPTLESDTTLVTTPKH